MTGRRWLVRAVAVAAVVVMVGGIAASMVWPLVVPRLAGLPRPDRTSCDWTWTRGSLFWEKHRYHGPGGPLPGPLTDEDGTVYRRDPKADCAFRDDHGNPLPGPDR